MSITRVYPEKNVATSGRKSYRIIVIELRKNYNYRIICNFFFLDCEHSSMYLSLDFYMENFHLFFPLLPEKGTFLTPKKRHMLEQ